MWAEKSAVTSLPTARSTYCADRNSLTKNGGSRGCNLKSRRRRVKTSPLSRLPAAHSLSMANCFGLIIAPGTASLRSLFRNERRKTALTNPSLLSSDLRLGSVQSPRQQSADGNHL